MEPLNCTVRLTAQRCEIWVGTQQQTRVHQIAQQLTGLSADQVVVHTPLIGGSFGRNLETDIVPQAIAIAKAVGRPVKVIWGREDNFRHDFFRPMALLQLRAVLDKNGWPSALNIKVVGPSSRRRSNPALLQKSHDRTLLDGLSVQPYQIPNYRLEYVEADLRVRVGWVRGVGFIANVFALESFIDEMATAAGKDPLDYRRHLVAHDPRLGKLLEEAAERADWTGARAQGRTLGVALTVKDKTRVAQIVEIDGDPRAHGRVVRAVTATDPGTVINPLAGTVNVEGSTMFGLSNSLYEGITVRDGAVVQTNFHQYSVLRMPAAPQVEVLMMPDGSPPVGLAEAGIDTIGPAVANAIASMTGDRCRRLPLTDRRPLPTAS
jgi:CO/xanthine dehydrogenase Mo-binding subunit